LWFDLLCLFISLPRTSLDT